MAILPERWEVQLPANGTVTVESEDVEFWIAKRVQVAFASPPGSISGNITVTDLDTGTVLLDSASLVDRKVYFLGPSDNRNDGRRISTRRLDWRATGKVRIVVTSGIASAQAIVIAFWKSTGDHRRDV